jgi:CBS domain-containing protein
MKKLKDLMTRDLVVVPPDMPVSELAGLLSTRMISGAPVVDAEGKVIGVVSLSDIAAFSASGQGGLQTDRDNMYYSVPEMEDYLVGFFTVTDLSPGATVRDIMTPAVYNLGQEATILEAADMMRAARIHRIIVTQDGHPQGIVTTMDLVGALGDELKKSIP